MIAAAARNRSRSRGRSDRIERIAHGPREAELLADDLAVDRIGRAGQRRRPQRAFVHAGACIVETTAVAREHFDIGEAMMAEGDRLGRLQMGEARHHRRRMRTACITSARCNSSNPADARAYRRAPRAADRLRPGRCASARCAARAGRTHDLREPGFDIEMDILQLAFESESALGNRSGDLVKPAHDRVGIGLGNDALGGKHLGMGLRACDIVIGKPFVEIDGDVYLLHDPGGAALETPAPHLVRRHGPDRCLACAC